MDHAKNTVCRELKEKLSDYLDGELESALCAEIERHLDGCDDCRVVVDTLNQTITLYRNHGQAEVPPGTHARLTHVLNIERLKQQRPPAG